MSEHWLYTGGRSYLVTGDDGGEFDDIVAWMATDRGRPAPVVALSRQQVLTRIARTTLPTGFPDPDVVIGDPDRETGATRGWLEQTVQRWEDTHLDTAAAPDDTPASATPVGDTTAVEDDAGAGSPWVPKTRVWEEPITADGRILVITSRGVVAPSGTVLAGPMPDGSALGALLGWRWPRKPKELPQLWLTYEALEALGFPTDSEAPIDAAATVAQLFGCDVSWSQSGWFTVKFGGDDDGQARNAHVVLIPLLYTDPPAQRPGDMGVAGWEGTATELPEDETASVRLLAQRMVWLSGIAEGVAPASRWATVGAQVLDAVRRRGRQGQKAIEACPLPAQVAVESGGQLEPIVAPTWDHRPHRAIGDQIDVEVDQRAAYLASAVQVELGHGPPRELQRISTAVFDEQKPPFGLWRITMPAAGDLDGLTKRLPLPHPAMRWDAPVTVWVTTRAVQHLSAPVELGGAGLSVTELDIDAAWVWPQQGRMLRTWADVLRAKLIEAREAGREDYQDFIKGIYTTYLGRMSTDKWGPQQRAHQQPAWYAAIRADTRWRALRYARRIADTHGLYPISAELDAWVYRLDPDVDPQILAEDSTANGKYRVKWTSAEAGEGVPA